MDICSISFAKARMKPGIAATLFALLESLDSSGHVSHKIWFPLKRLCAGLNIYSEAIFICRPNISVSDDTSFFIFEAYTLNLESCSSFSSVELIIIFKCKNKGSFHRNYRI